MDGEAVADRLTNTCEGSHLKEVGVFSTEIKKAVIVTIIKSSNYNSFYILYLSYLSCTFKTTHKLSFLIANLID